MVHGVTAWSMELYCFVAFQMWSENAFVIPNPSCWMV